MVSWEVLLYNNLHFTYSFKSSVSIWSQFKALLICFLFTQKIRRLFEKVILKKRKDVTAGQVVGCVIAPLLSNDT